MPKPNFILSLALVAGLLLVGAPGCSKKSVQSGGDTQSSEQGMAKSGGPGMTGPGGISGGGPGSGPGGGPGSGPGGVGSFPSTELAGRGEDSGSGLKGLDSVKGVKGPAEERVGDGTMMAKADQGDITKRQKDEIRREQAAAAAAGLRDVFFAYDSWTITDEGRQSLMHDAEWIKTNPSAQMKIEGHCDERGTVAYNLVLGEKRAKAVRNYLVELGVTATRLSVVSYGKERPFCREHAESCYQQNRRGHLVLRVK